MYNKKRSCQNYIEDMFPDETEGHEAMDILAKYIMEQDNIFC